MNGLIAQALPSSHFRLIDWIVVAAYLAGTTWLGARLAGKQATIRDFFLGGRKLPWWAVTGSNIATEISAVSIISVPAIVFAAHGDFRYLQLALGSIAARFIVAYWFVPAYYAREIYSPYQYMGQRLGRNVDYAATALFMIGATLGQGVRLFTTALVLQIVTGIDLWWSIWIIGAFSVAWTLMGGITTVIWTDVIQFSVLVAGAVVALFWVFHAVPGGPSEVWRLAGDAGKFRVLDFSRDLANEYTLWSGLFGMTFLNLAALGTDQVMAQRIFCCRDVRDARKAVLASNLGLLIPVLLLFVGAGLFAYFHHFQLSPEEAAMVAERGDRIFPIFIVKVLPAGITGLVIAAIFAAAISTLDGTLAALSQTTVMSIYVPLLRAWKNRTITADDHHAVTVSRYFVVFWGVVLSIAATALIPLRFGRLIDLALSVPAYTYGALLGTLLLALLPTRCDDRGLAWGVPASILAVVAVSVRGPERFAPFIPWIIAAGCVLLVASAVAAFRRDPARICLVVGAAATIAFLHWLTFPRLAGSPGIVLAYPWYYPIGTLVTFVLGWGLAGKKSASSN